MAKIIIDIDDDRFEKLKCGTENYLDYQIFLAKLHNATLLPNNATNGDVIKALFPNNKYVEGKNFVIIQGETENISLWNNWWNAPYKMESEGKDG